MELVGVAFNLVYTWMYLRGQVPAAYLFAAVGGVSLAMACWRKNLQAETALHAFYVGMAGYGAWIASGEVWVLEWGSVAHHILAVSIGALLSLGLRVLLKARGSSMPLLDAITTVFSVIATWWMIQGDPFNWLYWMAIDALSVYLYAKRGMPWGALLFAIYCLMAIDGWFEEISWFSG